MASHPRISAVVGDAQKSMANFDLNAIMRGAQLTVVGALRAGQNPKIFKYEHYRQAALAVLGGIIIRLLIAAPILLVKFFLWMLSFFINFEATSWDDTIVNGLDFFANSVLQVPFLLMSLWRYLEPTLDQLFMDSLLWVDQTYQQKHQMEDIKNLRPMYHQNLQQYRTADADAHGSPRVAILKFLTRFGRRTSISLAMYALSFLPYIGRFILPVVTFYTFNQAVGPVPAGLIFGTGIFLPRRFLIVFLQAYFSSRSLMRELLVPYFSRIKFTKEQKAQWFRDREGLLFGFAVGFWIFLRIPLIGVLIYGIAEASTAYLITKITDPPPPPGKSQGFAESQVRWRNKHEFLRLPLGDWDAPNMVDSSIETKQAYLPLQAGKLPRKGIS